MTCCPPPLYILARGCMGDAFIEHLLDHVCEQSGHWRMASTGHEAAPGGVRQVGAGRMGWTIPLEHHPAAVVEAFLPWFASTIEAACERLGLEPFNEPEVELQITAYHNRGGYIKHTDDGSEVEDHPHHGRRLSYVYYFHDEPKPFTGGELYFPDYDTTIEPVRDQLVCFASSRPHQVNPVHTGSKSPRSCRFTINGWVSEREA